MSEKEPEIFKLIAARHQKLCTKSLYLFYLDVFKTVDLFMFTVRLAGRSDDGALVAAKALLPVAKDEEERARYQATIDNHGATSRKLAEYSHLNSRHLVTNTVDVFLWYLSDIIKRSIKKQTNLLKSKETIRLDEIFDFNSRSDLIDYLIDRKVNELSYGGLKKLEDFISERLGIEMFSDERNRSLLKVFIELRNIHIHNRGFVNSLFMSRVGENSEFKFDLDKRYHVDFEMFSLLSGNCIKIASHIDASAASKFGIGRKRYRTWKNPTTKHLSLAT